jgi:hypothetical protein
VNAIASKDKMWVFGGRMVFNESVAGETEVKTSFTSKLSFIV